MPYLCSQCCSDDLVQAGMMLDIESHANQGRQMPCCSAVYIKSLLALGISGLSYSRICQQLDNSIPVSRRTWAQQTLMHR